MAIIGKIREKSTLLLIIVGLAMAAFILGDFFRGTGGGGEVNTIAEIYGEPLSVEEMQEYERRVNQQIEAALRNGGSLDAQARKQVEEYVWNMFIREKVYEKQIELLDIEVTKEELSDAIHGNAIHPIIQNQFKDSTGNFNRSMLVQFYQNRKQLPPEQQAQWNNLVLQIKLQRHIDKYTALAEKGLYVTDFEAKENYLQNTSTRDIRFVMKGYGDIPDDQIKVTEDDIYAYYKKHKNDKEYEQDGSRIIEFIRMDMELSEEDISKAKQSVESKINRFKKATNDSLFVASYAATEMYNPKRAFTSENLPPQIDSTVFEMEEGEVIGPYRDGDYFKITKVADLIDSARSARHILIDHKGIKPNAQRTKKQAKAFADSLMEVIQKDTSKFAELAQKYSVGPSSKDGGDLGYFDETRMVPPFSKFSFNSPVDSVGIVESQFGYHVVQITGAKGPKKAKLATIDARIVALGTTVRNFQEKAIEILNEAQDKDLEMIAEEHQFPMDEVEVSDEESRIPGIEEAGELVSWLREASEGDVSPSPVVSGNAIYIAPFKADQRKRCSGFEDVKEIMTIPTRLAMKAEKIMQDVKGANGLDEFAQITGSSIKSAQIKFADFGLGQGGGANEPAVIGAAFSNAQEGDVIGPIEGESGVYMILIEKSMKQKLATTPAINNRSPLLCDPDRDNLILEALKELANVKDKR